MKVSKRKQKILELEAELRIINNIFYIRGERGDGFHARHNKYILRAAEIRKELEEISLKWKIKKFLRRFDK